MCEFLGFLFFFFSFCFSYRGIIVSGRQIMTKNDQLVCGRFVEYDCCFAIQSIPAPAAGRKSQFGFRISGYLSGPNLPYYVRYSV